MELLVIITMWIHLLMSCLNNITPLTSNAKLQYSREFLLQWHRPYYVRYPVDFIRSQHLLNDGGFMEIPLGTMMNRKYGNCGSEERRVACVKD